MMTRMNIRNKILISYISVTTVVMGISFLLVYLFFAEYREEEFQQRLKEKITFTLQFLDQEIASDKSLLKMLDRLTINELYEEKTLLFDKDKKLIYTSLDDASITYSPQLLNQLNDDNNWIETKEGEFDVVAICVNFENDRYYGITKAYDTFGYTKLNYLKYALIFIFIFSVILAIVIALFISKQVSEPIIKIAREIGDLNFDTEKQLISVPSSGDEIEQLGQKFNQLMARLNESFAFQKHAIHHISHELKTPIAILVSNFERLENEQDEEKKKVLIRHQKEDTQSLGDIINALLEISKAESGNLRQSEPIRVDDLVFDIIDKINLLRSDIDFKVKIDPHITDEETLTIFGNHRLLKIAFTNLLHNSVQYSDDNNSTMTITSDNTYLNIRIENNGAVILPEERQYMFQHFFRGANSHGKPGFGLGLVLTSKIISLHQGKVRYITEERKNIFDITFPITTNQNGLSCPS